MARRDRNYERSEKRIGLTLIIDSFAWVELFSGRPAGLEARNRIAEADRVLTPDIVLAELARKFGRDGFPSSQIAANLRSVAVLSDIVPISVAVAITAVETDRELRSNAKRRSLTKPGLADAIVLAVARTFSGRVLTGDSHFEFLPNTEWLRG